jgi:hypothetical protein
MGRAPITLLLVLLALALQPATALGVDGDGEVAFEVPLKTNNALSAKLEADDDEIELTVSEGGQEVAYFAQGTVTPAGIAVKFGRLGEIVVDYEPFRTLKSREPGPRCEGEPRTTTEGFLSGTIRFRGERDYVRIEAARVKGTLVLNSRWSCQYGPAGASRAPARETEEDSATLAAYSRRNGTRFAAFGPLESRGKLYAAFFVTRHEVREGVGIARSTSAAAPFASFRFDQRRGTAFVDGPAPLAGWARYQRRPGAPDRWSGTLTAPLLGLGRVRLAGPGFLAGMAPELPAFG